MILKAASKELDPKIVMCSTRTSARMAMFVARTWKRQQTVSCSSKRNIWVRFIVNFLDWMFIFWRALPGLSDRYAIKTRSVIGFLI